MKKMNLKNQKVLIGLMSLLFVTSFVHTKAIVGIGKSAVSEPAQVISANSNNCLQVGSAYNFLEDYKSDSYPPGNVHTFTIYLNIRNVCGNTVHIMNSASMNQYNKLGQVTNLTGVSLQTFNSVAPLSPIEILPGQTNYPITIYNESVRCLDCVGGEALYYTSPVGTQGNVNAFTLNAYQGKVFELSMVTATPIDNLLLYRVVPKKIKWFHQNALSDSIVSATEVKTTAFSSADQLNLATDYLRGNLVQ